MNDYVIGAVERLLLDAGMTTMRFNFRPVEPGTTYAGVKGAVEDALNALDVFISMTGLPHVGVVGYSFGGSVALHLAALREIEFLVALSASYTLASEVVSMEDRFSAITCPVLLIHGDSDRVVPPTDMQALVSLLDNAEISTVRLDGEGHFYNMHLDMALDEVRTFVSQQCTKLTYGND